jgi:O-antigen/teichoic acid export membrane protein
MTNEFHLSAGYQAVRKCAPAWARPWLARLEGSAIGSRMAHGMFWSVIGTVVYRGMTLVVAVVTARILGKEVFGELGVIQSTIMMFGTFATLSMGLTASKHVAEFRTSDPARAGRVIGMSSMISWISGSVMALVVMVLAPWLSAHTLAAPHLSTALSVATFCLLFVVVSEAQIGTLSGFEAFKRRSIIQLVAGLVSLPVTVVGVYWWGLIGALVAQAVSLAVLVFLNTHGIRKEAHKQGIPVAWKGAFQESKVFWSFSIPTILGGAMYVPVVWVANAILVNTPNGYAAMGVFSGADRWRTAVMFLPALLGGVALPMLTSLRAEESITIYQKVLWANIKLSTGAALSIAIPIAMLSPWIMASYGKGFTEGKWVLVLLCISCVAASADWIIGQSLFSRGRVWLKFWLNTLWGVEFLTTAWLLRERGASALALAYVFADCSRLATVSLVMRLERKAELKGE